MRSNRVASARGLLMQRGEVGMFDLPAARHLFDHKLGVHRHLDVGGAQLRGLLQTRDQPAIFGDVVGGAADGLLALGEHRRRGRPTRPPTRIPQAPGCHAIRRRPRR